MGNITTISIRIDSDLKKQMENLCRTILNEGRAGIRCFGYNFSACGVQGYRTDYNSGNQDGRGLAATKSFDEAMIPTEPQCNPYFWFNTRIERRGTAGILPPCGVEEFWARFRWFLERFPYEALSLEDCLPEELAEKAAGGSIHKGYLQLLPGIHRCDGFFIAKFRRKPFAEHPTRREDC